MGNACCAEEGANANFEPVEVFPEKVLPPRTKIEEADASVEQRSTQVTTPSNAVTPVAAPAEPPSPAAAVPAVGNTSSGVVPSALFPAASDVLVEVEKSPGITLGLGLELLDGMTALITDVNPGAVMTWNQANPAKAVGRLHRIIEVNGVKGDLRKITEELEGKSKLSLLVRPPAPEMEVSINKDAVASLGFDLNFAPNSSHGLLISQVSAGPVEEWNAKRDLLSPPGRKVKAMDRILGVERDGQTYRDVPAHILQQLSGATQLKLLILPYEE